MKKKLILSAVALLVVIVALVKGCGEEESADAALYAEVKEGPLVIDIEESGEIVASESLTLKSEVQGRCTVITLVPEGTKVKEGDVLVQLDVSTKIDEKDSQEITLKNAESALEVAREELEIQKNQSASDVELAEQDLLFANEDLEKYEQGEYPAKLVDQKGQLALKEQQVKQAKDKYEWSKKLFAEHFISETELEGDELSWKSSQLALDSAQRELVVLETYTHRRDLAKFKSDVRQKGMALERAKKKAASSISKSESDLRAKESEFIKQRQKLDKLTNQIAKATIRAPKAGQVVYAKTGWREEPLRLGIEVRERQDLIELPVSGSFQAKFSLREANIKTVVTGMPVRVRCDAIPGKVFSGFVKSVAPMPDNERSWMNSDLKEYPSKATITDGLDQLRSGMGCKVEIIVAEYPKALYVPVQCVVRIAGRPYVWLRGRGGDERREVETGLANSRFIRIISGLEEGDEVSLAPPLKDSSVEETGTAK